MNIKSKLAEQTHLAQHENVIDGGILTQQVSYPGRTVLGFHDPNLAARRQIALSALQRDRNARYQSSGPEGEEPMAEPAQEPGHARIIGGIDWALYPRTTPVRFGDLEAGAASAAASGGLTAFDNLHRGGSERAYLPVALRVLAVMLV